MFSIFPFHELHDISDPSHNTYIRVYYTEKSSQNKWCLKYANNVILTNQCNGGVYKTIHRTIAECDRRGGGRKLWHMMVGLVTTNSFLSTPTLQHKNYSKVVHSSGALPTSWSESDTIYNLNHIVLNIFY